MKDRIELTEAEIQEITRLREIRTPGGQRMGLRTIALQLGIPSARIRRVFEPGYVERKKKWQAYQSQQRKARKKAKLLIINPRIPPEVIADRDRRATLRALCTDPNVLILNDPIR